MSFKTKNTCQCCLEHCSPDVFQFAAVGVVLFSCETDFKKELVRVLSLLPQLRKMAPVMLRTGSNLSKRARLFCVSVHGDSTVIWQFSENLKPDGFQCK